MKSIRALAAIGCVCCLSVLRPAFCDEPQDSQLLAANPKSATHPLRTAQKLAPAAGKAAAQDHSTAEYIAQLERAIAADMKELDDLRKGLDDPNSEFHQAEAEFKRLDDARSERKKQLEHEKHSGQKKNMSAAAAADSEAEWQAAKARFELAIEERKTRHEKVDSLTEKTRRDGLALEDLTGFPAPEEAQEHPLVPANPTKHAGSDGPAPAAPTPAQTAPTLKTPVPAPAPQAVPAQSSTEPTSAGLAGEIESAAETAPHDHDHDQASEELASAQEEARAKEAAAKVAASRAESITERFETLRKNIAIEERLLSMARTRSDQAQDARALLDKELQRTLVEDPAGLDTMWKKIAAADGRLIDVRAETRETHNRLDELRVQLDSLQQEQLVALRDAKSMHDAADAAQGRVARLQNPFTPHNLLQWAVNHGPKLFGILLATLILQLLVKSSGRHLARIVARGGSRGTQNDRENRALTLVGVFRNAASLVLFGGGTLMTLDEVGIPIMPLMGGAAVFGLAVAFGAQNLMRDYFSGFMMLMEDQYGINDVVRIGDIAGLVEKITLRITVLRDMDGAVHFLPHGSVTRVSNLTHGWSRAVVEVSIAYKEDSDYVMNVLMEIAQELRKDPVFGPVILDEPEMLGIDRFDDSAVVIKFVLKTHPLKRWPVRRELLRRIKRKFDELDIEIPFPHRAIYTHQATDNVQLKHQPESPRKKTA